MSHMPLTAAASMADVSVASTRPPTPSVGARGIATIDGAVAAVVTVAVLPQTALSISTPLASTTATRTCALAMAAPEPGKKAATLPGLQATTAQATPPMLTRLASQRAASMPALLTLTRVQPEAERIEGDTAVMESTWRGRGQWGRQGGEVGGKPGNQGPVGVGDCFPNEHD